MFFNSTVKNDASRTFSLQDRELLSYLGIEDNAHAKETTYYTCMRIRTDTTSKIPVKLLKDGINGVEKSKEHYLYNLLKIRPNPYMSASDFWGAVEYSVLDTGRCVVYIDTHKNGRNAGRVKGLYPLNTANLEVWIDNKGIIGNKNAMFYIYRQNGQDIKLSVDEVLDFKGLTADGINTTSINDYLKGIIDNAKQGQNYVNKFFRNGLFAKGIIQYTGDLDQKTAEMMTNRLAQAACGTNNLGGILAMPVGTNFVPTNVKMADAQFLELNQLSIKQIANAFGIKAHQLNDLERATHTNIEQQQLQYYIDTLMPVLTRYEQELTYKLLTEVERREGLYFRFNVDVILRADLNSKVDSLTKLVQNGVITPNEARDELDRSKNEAGDMLIANGNYIPLNMVGQQYTKGESFNGESSTTKK